MYTPHIITLFNTYENEFMELEINMTCLEGVFLDTTKSNRISNNGANSADTATLFVPFSVNAYDAISGQKKVFYKPKEYHAMDDNTGAWTLETAGDTTSASCYFVKGKVDTAMDYNELREKYSDVYDVSAVRTLDFGSDDMQHWMVSAR